MDRSQCHELSTPQRVATKRTRSNGQQRRRHHCRQEYDRQRSASKAMDNCGISGPPSCPAVSSLSEDSCDVSANSVESVFATTPRASVRPNRQCIKCSTLVALVATTMLLCYPSIATFANASSSLHLSIYNSRPSLVASFVVPPVARGSLFHRHPSMSIQRETSQQKRQKPSLDTTWSNAVREKSELNESRFGVRKRVRSVLDKAKKRTGIENSSTSTVKRDTEPKRINGDASYYQTGPNVVAEAASLGGLGAVVVDDEGTVDAALDYIGNKGGQTGNLYNDTSSGGSTSIKSGETYEDPAILTKVGNEVLGASTKNGVKVSSPTSSVTPNIPSMAPNSFQRPEDDFILKSKDTEKVINDTSTRKPYVEKDAFTGDVSAAFSLPREPLPFELPSLDREQTRRLIAGERVQFQDDMGRAGSGYVVWDVKAPASVVWDCLLDFQSYPQTITTVREVVMYTNTHLKEDYRAEKPLDFEDGTAAICKHGVPSVTRAQFSLSKFRLKIAAVHKYRPHPKGDYMIFTLDKASSNPVLKYAKGIWYTESNPDGKEGYTRVWLLCELRVSRLLPQWIVDYAAARAMPRATTWLKPQTEAAAMLWLKDSAERDSRRN